MRTSRTVFALTLCVAMLAAGGPTNAFAATQPDLGTALNFTALAASAVSNTGPSVVTGNLGIHPGSAVTGFPPGIVTGTIHTTDAPAQQAQVDLTTAYTSAATAPTTSDLSGQDLGGLKLTPGVYRFTSSAQLTGPLTLSGNGVFIFQVGSALTTASNSSVVLSNGAQACAIYWQIGSSATLGTFTWFQGNLMALSSITLNTGASIVSGRALARTGALTLDSNRITAPVGPCTVAAAATPSAAPVAPAPKPAPAPGVATPTVPRTGGSEGGSVPGGVVLIMLGLTAMTARTRRRRRRS